MCEGNVKIVSPKKVRFKHFKFDRFILMLLPLNIEESSVDTLVSAETIKRRNFSSYSNMSDHDSYIANFVRPLIDLLPDWLNVPQAWLDDPGMHAQEIITFALGVLVDAAFGEYERYRSHIPYPLFYMIREYTTRNTSVPSILHGNPGHEEVVSSLGNSAQK